MSRSHTGAPDKGARGARPVAASAVAVMLVAAVIAALVTSIRGRSGSQAHRRCSEIARPGPPNAPPSRVKNAAKPRTNSTLANKTVLRSGDLPCSRAPARPDAREVARHQRQHARRGKVHHDAALGRSHAHVALVLTACSDSSEGTPSVDAPVIIPAQQADAALADDEQVMLFEHADQARAYPIRSLIRHEIVNDTVGRLPVAVTWCPLCNTGITFDRRVNGKAEVFGVSGALYRSALVMCDRRTTSL